MMEQLALSHPEISFKYIQNKQVKLHTSGNYNVKDVIYNVYGRDMAKALLEVFYENDFMKIAIRIPGADVLRAEETVGFHPVGVGFPAFDHQIRLGNGGGGDLGGGGRGETGFLELVAVGAGFAAEKVEGGFVFGREGAQRETVAGIQKGKGVALRTDNHHRKRLAP